MTRIFLADKDPEFRELVRRASVKLGCEGFVWARSSPEALRKVDSETFDLALIDSGMALKNGGDLPLAIKRRNPRCLTIMTFDKGQFDQAQKALHRGADRLLNKGNSEERFTDALLSALKEANRMKGTGNSERRHEDEAIIRRGIITGTMDSLLVGSGAFSGFILQAFLDNIDGYPAFIWLAGIILLCLGLASAYGFVYVYKKSYRKDIGASSFDICGSLLQNLTFAYIFQLAILFITGELIYASIRLSLGLGFVIGYLSLLANRFLLLPAILPQQAREGKKKLTIISKRSEKSEEGQEEAIAKLLLSRAGIYRIGERNRMEKPGSEKENFREHTVSR